MPDRDLRLPDKLSCTLQFRLYEPEGLKKTQKVRYLALILGILKKAMPASELNAWTERAGMFISVERGLLSARQTAKFASSEAARELARVAKNAVGYQDFYAEGKKARRPNGHG